MITYADFEQVDIRVEYCGICHSDLHAAAGILGRAAGY